MIRKEEEAGEEGGMYIWVGSVMVVFRIFFGGGDRGERGFMWERGLGVGGEGAHVLTPSSREPETPMTDAPGIEGSMAEIYPSEVYPEPAVRDEC